jgi:glycosidase
MCYSKDIAQLEAKVINNKSVNIVNQVRTDNSNYLWITLNLKNVVGPKELTISFMRGDALVREVPYIIEAKPNFGKQNGFDQSDVIYLITPDRFADGDSSNNSFPDYKDVVDRKVPLARHGGDLKGIVDHLDYIKNMGFTAVWLNPIIENNNSKYSYHGYAATDFYRIDARFGTNEEYKEFVELCHQKDLKVIMDMIHNHCSDEHFWMKDLPAKDWVNIWPEYTQTNHRKATLQDIHASKIDKKTYLDGWFVPTMPDLNQRNKLLSTYLIQNAIWWSLYLKLDGIRMDTYSYPEKKYMKDWVESMQREVPQVSIVGEEWSVNPAHVAYWQKGKINPDGFTSDLQYLMDFPTNQLLAEALKENEDWNKGLIRIYESLANDFMYPEPNDLLIFLDNHDMTRGFTTLGEDVDLLKLAMIFCMTTRGVPQVYYGTEILMTSPLNRDDGRIRADYPGGWEDDKINAFTGEGLSEEKIEFRSFLTKLLNERKDEKTLHYGKLTHFVPENGVYVYFRHMDGEKIMVIINKNKEPFKLELERFTEFLENGNIRGVELLSDDKIDVNKEILLDPLRGYIIKIEGK